MALSYVLALTGVLGNGGFATITIVNGVHAPVVGQMFMPEAVLGAGGGAAAKRGTPPEEIGVDQPGRRTAWPNSTRELGLPANVTEHTASAQFGEPSPAATPKEAIVHA